VVDKIDGRIVSMILGLIVVILLIFVFLFNRPLIDSMLNSMGFGTGDKETKDKASLQFSDFQNVITDCIQSKKSDCFCTKQKILFPTDYRLELNNDQNFKLHISLMTETKEIIAKMDTSITGCNLISKISQNQIDDPLDMKYGSKSYIEYKKSKFEFLPEMVFYKRQDQLCIIEKSMLSSLNQDNIC
jgi:hypothetical protein